MCKNFTDLLDYFEKNGISWNAYTSDSKIVFYITGLDEYINDIKDELVNRLITFDTSKIDFDTEKKIILEEYTDTFNKQSTSHFLNLYRKLFDNYNPIGELNDIKNLSTNDCNKYWNDYYKSPSTIINVSKHNKYQNDIKFNNLNNNYELNYIENNDFILQKTNIFKSKTSVIYLSPIITENYPIVRFITSLLSNGLKSPLYQEVREKTGLVYYISCYLDYLTDSRGVINISTETSENKTEELYDKIRNVLGNKEKYITRERFENIKKSYNILYKKSEINRYDSINRFISPNNWLIEPIIDNITLKDVYDIYDEYFNIDKFYISYDKSEFL